MNNFELKDNDTNLSYDEIEIIMPDDFHHHFRDNEFLNDVVPFTAERFGKVIAMPNTKPPTTNCPSPPILNRPPLNATRAAIAIPLINAIFENVENR